MEKHKIVNKVKLYNKRLNAILFIILLILVISLGFYIFKPTKNKYVYPYENTITCNRYDTITKIYIYSQNWVEPNTKIKYNIYILPNKNNRYYFEKFNLYKWTMDPEGLTEENKIYDQFYKNSNKSGSFIIYKEGVNIVNFMIVGYEQNNSEGLTICRNNTFIKVHPTEYETTVDLQLTTIFVGLVAVVIALISLLHSILKKDSNE